MSQLPFLGLGGELEVFFLPFSFIAAGGANQDQQTVKASPGVIHGFTLHNVSAAMRYVKIYDKASPTSADTPKLRFPLAPNGGGVARPPSYGIAFATAIGIRITTGVADNDTGTCTSGDVVVNIEFK